MGPEFDPLAAYVAWFLRQPLGSVRPPFWAVRNFGTVISFVLHRQPPFQTELFIVPPEDLGFPLEHRHPNVDTYEVHLSGQLPLTVNGQRLTTDEYVRAVAEDGACLLSGQITHIGPNDWHGAAMAPEDAKGSAFLSLQHWLNDTEPTSVGLNWEGPATHEEQKKLWKEHGIAPNGNQRTPPAAMPTTL